MNQQSEVYQMLEKAGIDTKELRIVKGKYNEDKCYVYDTLTGERSKCLLRMLPTILKKTHHGNHKGEIRFTTKNLLDGGRYLQNTE